MSTARRDRTLVIQSHRLPLPAAWLTPCLESVQAWAADRGYDYRFEDDVLFERLAPDLRHKTLGHPVIASDLARLAALERAFESGHDAAVWVDADTLVFDPEGLELPDDSYALGREVWVQPHRGRLRAYVKVHNAFLMFRRGNPFLAFYRHAAERIVRAHQGPMAPQLVGPKLLTALHNLVDCPVVERAAMLSPAVAAELAGQQGTALELFARRSRATPAAVNLCGSLVGREIGAATIQRVIERLRDAGTWPPGDAEGAPSG